MRGSCARTFTALEKVTVEPSGTTPSRCAARPNGNLLGEGATDQARYRKFSISTASPEVSTLP